jgi:hypothetical protein
MFPLRFCAVVSVVSLACGGGAPAPRALSSSWQAPAILSHIPADSPYVFASLAPMNDDARRRWLGSIEREIAQAMRKLDTTRAGQPPWMRAVMTVVDELRNKAPDTWGQELGVDPRGLFAIYGLSVWPVARIELTNPARLRGMIERALAAAGVQPRQETLGGRPYWTFDLNKVSLIAAVLDREAVIAVVPTQSLPSALPLVLGIKNPAQNLATAATVPDVLGRYRFTASVLGYFDLRNALAAFTRDQPSELEAPLHALTGPISPVCRTDLERLVAVAPRLVTGYRRLDATGFDGTLIVESPPAVSRGLAKLRAAVSEVTVQSTGQPLFAFGAAVNPEAVTAWLRGITADLHDHPFTCPWLTELNTMGAKLAGTVSSPLPPMLQGFRGFSLVLDNATIIPPAVDGHLLLAGDHVGDMLSLIAPKVPQLGNLPLKRDGHPVALPIQQLGIPLPSAHIAMTSDRLIITAGSNSEQRATAHLASPTPARSPLFVFAFDGMRLQQLIASMGQSGSLNLDYLGNVWMAFDATDDGLAFDVSGTWGAGASAATAPPPK